MILSFLNRCGDVVFCRKQEYVVEVLVRVGRSSEFFRLGVYTGVSVVVRGEQES